MKVPLTVNDFLDRAERVYGDRVALVDEPDQPAPPLPDLTYREVAALARAQAAGLDALGIGEGERVAIVSHNAARLLVALFGVSGSGRILVPVNFRLNADEVAYIVEHSGASVLLVDPDLDDHLRAVDAPHRFVIGVRQRRGAVPTGRRTPAVGSATRTRPRRSTTRAARPPDRRASSSRTGTSGSTPRRSGGSSASTTATCTCTRCRCSTATGGGCPTPSPGMGGRHIVLRKVDGAEILRRIDRHGVTMLNGAPTVVNTVIEAAKEWPGEIPGRGRVRITVAGAPPPTRTIEAVETVLGWEFVQIYGLTETTPLLTMNRSRAEYDELSPADRAARLGRAGAPALGVDLAVDDEGEVLARSNVVMDGYWDNPEATDAALAGGWFHTGDGGFLDDEHYLTISDRKKDVIISGGENVSSIEVEDCLFSHPAVAEVAVIGVPDEQWGETVKALVVVADGATADEAELIEHCRERLAHYKCPTSVEVRDELARTATGKLQKFRLRAPYWEGRDRQVG